ncbi:WxL domain-containing protein [Salinicoccus hispanicus]|uniref:WxL domain-containing protein n=1 Tax=Salinicoccus hispanicus TaxID=157225 RepID=A0A6N8U156_9STAP|nr:WxL domain-containing protein [Salinicoccus hispanicus]MXQ51077.1 WxL domain-containing protein [Salinicoccus hispanicus]
MKFKTVLTALLVTSLSVSSLSSVASAADSEAEITFTPGDGAPDVLDPTTPEETYDPESGTPGDPTNPPTGETGPLTLDYVSSLEFGSHQIESSLETYESTTLRPFVQVTDRRGTGAGWHVTAEMSSFTTGEGDTAISSLPGAELTLTGTTMNTTSSSGAPTPSDTIELSSDGTVSTVVNAGADTGLGSWIARWFPSATGATSNDNVTLEVPAGAATLGDHTATITWTLENTPQ